MDAPLRSQTIARRRPRSRNRPPGRPTGAPEAAIVELVQRARIVLDVTALDLAAAEETLGPFHPTTCAFRDSRADARRAWDRLQAVLGSPTRDAASLAPPGAVVPLHDPSGAELRLILLGGRTYAVEAIATTALAPALWRLTRVPPGDDEPLYAARLRDGTTRCDCAEWVYDIAERPGTERCKHLAGLRSLGWL